MRIQVTCRCGAVMILNDSAGQINGVMRCPCCNTSFPTNADVAIRHCLAEYQDAIRKFEQANEVEGVPKYSISVLGD